MTATSSLCEQVSRLRQSSRELIRELGFLDLKNPYVEATAPQIHVLLEVDKQEGITVADLARILNLNQSSTCRTIAEMRKMGWIETIKIKNDRKRKPLRLTKVGCQKVTEINATCSSIYQKALERLPLEKREMVVEAFQIYAEALYSARQE